MMDYEISAFPMIIAIIFCTIFLCPIVSKKIYKSSKDNYRWIGREFTLLKALLKDYRAITSSVGKINQIAYRVWESELGTAGITLQLNKAETDWLKRAETVASKAEVQLRSYEGLKAGGRDLLGKKGLGLLNLDSTVRTALKLKEVKIEIESCFTQQGVSVHRIIESMELSKSIVLTLQDGPIAEEDHPLISSRPSFRSGAALVSILRSVCKKAGQVWSMDMQLVLLHAFMKDLRGLRLEREIEKAWLTEAQLIIIQTENEVNALFYDMTYEWLFSFFTIWAARRKLKKKIRRLFHRMADLLESNERYGFKFIMRESGKFAHPSLLQPGQGDMVVLSIIDEIRGRIDQCQETSSQVRGQVAALCRQLKTTAKLLKDTKAVEAACNTRALCYEQLTKLASDTKDLTEKHSERKKSLLSFSFFSRSRYLSEIHAIEEDVILLQRSIKMYSIEIVEDSSSVFGLEEDTHDLVSKLTSRVAQKCPVISIVGMKGIGKTTLAKKIYNHISILNHFHVRKWLFLPPNIRTNWRLIDHLKKILGSKEERKENEKRYLIVLDNLFSTEDWDVLETVISDAGINELKIVTTTRYKAVASYVDPSNIHQLRLRTKEESWKIFTQMINFSSDVEVLAKKAVLQAGGLPLAILQLGYLFAGKEATENALSRALDRVMQGQNQSLWLETWDLNKDYFQSHPSMSQILSYFESFPMDFEIPARRLVAVLVARGLVAEDTNETHENVAYEYLSELINRNVIQVVERKLNGDVKTCRFPSTLRQLWQRRRREGWPIRSWYLINTSLESQLTYHFDDRDAGSNHRIPGLRANLPTILQEDRSPSSIMFFDTREGTSPGADIGSFLFEGIKSRRFQDLLVLDLEGVFRPNLPIILGKLKQLKYLGLRWTQLAEIPSSIGNLMNLQTLDVKYTSIQTLHVSVWALKKLRHLYLNEYCRIKFMPKPSTISMEDLQTLSGVFLDEESPLKDGLDKLNSLRKLGLAFQLSLPQQKTLEKSILKLTNLRSLSLSSVDEKNKPQGLELENLSELSKLSSLYLFGKLERPSVITNNLPRSLTELILSASQLPHDPMENLGKLPELKSLSFFSGSYQGTNMVFSKQSFPQLMVLKLWSLANLEALDVEEGAMPNLREMEIRSCRNLTGTNGLTHLETLQEIKLTNMPEQSSVAIRTIFAVAIEKSWRKIIHCPKIKVENSISR